MLTRNSLPQDVQDEIDKVLNIPAPQRTEVEKEFLWARRDYFSRGEIEDFEIEPVGVAKPEKVARAKKAKKAKK